MTPSTLVLALTTLLVVSLVMGLLVWGSLEIVIAWCRVKRWLRS